MSNYALDANLAKQGSGGTGGRIQETGKYLGLIKWARELVYDTSTAIEICFVSQNDQEAKIKIFVTSNDPTKGASYGLKQLNALMTCLKLRAINGVNGTVNTWDFDKGAMTDQQATVFPELAGKPIGFILQKEHHVYNNELKYDMVIAAPFSIETEQTAKEILDGKNEKLVIEKLESSIEDRYRKGAKEFMSGGQAQAPVNSTTHPAQAPAEEIEDFIPF
jgi:hypothetical protein